MSDESVFSTAEWGIETAKGTAASVATETRKTLDQMLADAAQKENVIVGAAAESYEGAKQAAAEAKGRATNWTDKFPGITWTYAEKTEDRWDCLPD